VLLAGVQAPRAQRQVEEGGMRLRSVTGLAMLVAVSAFVGAGLAAGSGLGNHSVQATGSLLPKRLPRARQVPVRLQVGFRSPSVDGSVPGLERISFEIFSSIDFTAWRHRCSLAVLYSDRNPRKECPGSLIGQGSVSSEITVPGQAPVAVTGRLFAFYSLGGGEPRILAQVITGDPLPLIYVIPFTLRSAEGRHSTALFVPPRQMRNIAGSCAPEYPDCFAPSPYTLKGVYGHISELTMSLHSVLPRRPHPVSFVNGRCSFPDLAVDRPPLLRVSLDYSEGASASGVVDNLCKPQAR
jgi:hypothetical protein